ncbi:MAG TPA: hypothetical protein VF723_17580 [Pyrinomonadaceae bacterium]|jgi:hypothetical protein
MREPEREQDAAGQDCAASEVGDVETAGETTAADAISGPQDTTPVGHDTLAKLSSRPETEEGTDG